MQAFPAWTPPGGTLGRIDAEAERRAGELKRRRSALEADAARQPRGPSLVAGLRGPEVAVVAELKRRSPSRGTINDDLSASWQAAAYVAGGAAAVSILTEPRHFGGSGDDLARVREAVRVPLLKKDFHVDPVQLLEARALGASAVLLIARALDPRRLAALVAESHRLELEVVLEIRTEVELERAVSTGAAIVGVNSRDLESLAIDVRVTERLIPLIPASSIAIAESGLAGPSDVRRVAALGADAVLVGSALSGAADPSAAVRSLTGVRRSPRGR